MATTQTSFAGGVTLLSSTLDDATATQLGLKQYLHGTTYNGGNAPTVTLAGGGGTLSSVERAVFIPYQTQDGAWRLRFTINVTLSSATRTSASLAVNGITTKNVTGYFQALSCSTDAGASVVSGYASVNSSILNLAHTSATTTGSRFSGDIELNAKPTWAY